MINGHMALELAIQAFDVQKKAYNRREKDIRDVRLYELYRDYAANFDNKSYLKRQIEKEFYRKR